jgi:DNA-binding MarR family transcriptional regulator
MQGIKRILVPVTRIPRLEWLRYWPPVMSEPLKDLLNVDRVVHEPSRLVILTVLDACKSASFKYLLAASRLSTTNLSMQITKLEQHGLVAVDKSFVGKRPRTDLRLTPEGKTAIHNYWRRFENARRDVRKWTLQHREPTDV